MGLWEAMSKLPMLVVRGAQSDVLPEAIALEMKTRHPCPDTYRSRGRGSRTSTDA